MEHSITRAEQSTLQAGRLLATSIALPRVPASDAAQARVSDWLADIAEQPAAAALARLLADQAAARGLSAAFAEGAPYLWGPARAGPVGRGRNRDVAVVPGRAGRGGVGRAGRFGAARTGLAGGGVAQGVGRLLGEAARAGAPHPADPERPEQGSGYFVLALGKMGGNELNYSSDIDLIVLYDVAAATVAPGTELAPFYVRLTRRLVKLLGERTADGYVFRIDLRLRPDPASTQIAVSTAAALHYYESVGQNWERAALIKARPCAADIPPGPPLLHPLSPLTCPQTTHSP